MTELLVVLGGVVVAGFVGWVLYYHWYCHNKFLKKYAAWHARGGLLKEFRLEGQLAYKAHALQGKVLAKYREAPGEEGTDRYNLWHYLAHNLPLDTSEGKVYHLDTTKALSFIVREGEREDWNWDVYAANHDIPNFIKNKGA